jgi:hypothetical protein
LETSLERFVLWGKEGMAQRVFETTNLNLPTKGQQSFHRRRTELLLKIGECVATIDFHLDLKEGLKKELKELTLKKAREKPSQKAS